MRPMRQDYLRELACLTQELQEASGDGFDLAFAQHKTALENLGTQQSADNALDYEIFEGMREISNAVSHLSERLYRLERLWPEAQTHAKSHNRIAQLRAVRRKGEGHD